MPGWKQQVKAGSMERDNPSGSRRASIDDVAYASGVSRQTVSRVINNSGYVAEQTRMKVEDAIRHLHYQPSQSARALATRHSRMIAVIAGGINYFGPLSTISALEQTARARGYFISLANVDERGLSDTEFSSIMQGFSQLGAEAYVIVAPTDAMLHAVKQVRFDVPCVIITGSDGDEDIEGYLEANSTVYAVSIDQWDAVGCIAETVYSDCFRHQGAKDSGSAAAGSMDNAAYYLAGPLQWRDAYTRRAAWEAACTELGMESTVIDADSWDAQAGYSAVEAILGEAFGDKGPESGKFREGRNIAVVCANDLLAFGALRALGEYPGLDIDNRDTGRRLVKIAGYDDMPGSDSTCPPLSTVKPDFGMLGSTAMEILLNAVEDPGSAEGPEETAGDVSSGAEAGNGIKGWKKGLTGNRDTAVLPQRHGVIQVPAQFIRRESL